MAKTSGMRVKLTLFIPYDPKVPTSIAEAAKKAESLCSADGIKALGDTIELEGFGSQTVNRK